MTGAREEIAARRGVRVATETINADLPATCDPTVVETIAAACRIVRHRI